MPRAVKASETLATLHKNGSIEFTDGQAMLKVGVLNGENEEIAVIPLSEFVGLTEFSVTEFVRKTDKATSDKMEAEKIIGKLVKSGFTQEQITAMFQAAATSATPQAETPKTPPTLEPAPEPPSVTQGKKK